MVGADTINSQFQRLALVLGQGIAGAQQFGAWQLQRGHVRRVESIKAMRVLEHRSVTFAAHPLEDLCDSGLDGVVGGGVEGKKRRQPALEVGVAGIESVDKCHLEVSGHRRVGGRFG